VSITKAKLEGLFVEELERFQPTPGYMRLLKESVLRVWHERKAVVKTEVAGAEQRAKAIQQKLDRLDDAFIYKESIDLGTYERQRDRLREDLTLVEIDRHGSKVEEFDVEGHPELRRAGATAGGRPVDSSVVGAAPETSAPVLP
jgi:hypothetical protein